MRKLLYIPLVLLLAVSACKGTDQTKAVTSLAIACNSYATMLDQLTPKKPTMSKENVARIDAVNQVVSPACKKDSPFDPAAVVATVENGLQILSVLKASL